MTRADLRIQIVLIVAMVLLLGSAMAVTVRYQSEKEEDPETDVLFLPSGKYLKTVSFGYDNLLADVIYLWSIQYYTDFARETRFPYLLHTFDVITDLDPQYIDAYMIGALIIIAEGKDMASAIRLLNKGIANNPDDYLLPLDAGYYYRDTFKEPGKAAYYFGVAASRPSAPNYIKRLSAGLTERAGDKRTSYQLWKRAFDEAEKEEDRVVCELHLRTLQDEINLASLSALLAAYRERHGQYPSSLEQLVREGMIDEVPLDFRGNPYDYDPHTGEVAGSRVSVVKEH